MTLKKFYTISLLLITFALALFLFLFGFRYNARQIAMSKITTEVSELLENNKTLENQKNELSDKLNDIQTELSTKSTVNNYFIEAKKINDELKLLVDDLKKQSSALDADIEKRQNELSATSTTKEIEGSKYTLEKGETYSCPDNIPSGRYTATGTGSLIIYSSSNKVRVNENLSVEVGNSYTFNLAENEKIKVTNDVTLTELQQQ